MPWEGDDEILNIVKGLCQQLNITSYNPTSITWNTEVARKGRFGWIFEPLPYDECVLRSNTVILPENMRDHLEPGEWRPIIASALFYKKTLLFRRVTGIALRAGLFIALAIALFIILPILLPQPTTTFDRSGVPHTNPEGWLIASIVGPLSAIAGTSVLAILYLKNVRLLADKDAAELVGAPVFLVVLNKIAGLDANGYGKTNNRRGAGVKYLPPISQRIANLQGYSA